MRRRSNVRPVSPTFLSALGLSKVTTEDTTTTSVSFSKSRGTDTDKNAGGSHTSASKELILPPKKRPQIKSVAVRSAKKKKEHVPKPKDQTKKRSQTTSFDEPQSIPVVVVKKMRKRAAPDTDKPTTKKEPQDVKNQQHKASLPAMNVSPSAHKSTVKTAENLTKLTSATDDFRLWSDILESDFKSVKYTTLLLNNQFTEEQTEAIQQSFQNLVRAFCRRPTKRQRFMKTHECIICNFSISHECMSTSSPKYWPFCGNAPFIEYVTPESITMCTCNFFIFHSHCPQLESKRKAKSLVRSPSPSPSPTDRSLVENNRSVNFGCPSCNMNIFISNRNKDVCSGLMNFEYSPEGPNRKKFSNYVHNYLEFRPKDYPKDSEFYSCRNLCCMLFHRCSEDFIVRNTMPKQPHRPLYTCKSRRQMESV